MLLKVVKGKHMSNIFFSHFNIFCNQIQINKINFYFYCVELKSIADTIKSYKEQNISYDKIQPDIEK